MLFVYVIGFQLGAIFGCLNAISEKNLEIVSKLVQIEQHSVFFKL